MRRRRFKILWRRLHEMQQQTLTRDALLLKLGAAKKEAGRAYHLVEIQLPDPNQPVTPETFSFPFAATSCAPCAAAKAGIYCAPTCPTKTPPPCGNTTSASPRSNKHSKSSKHDLAIRPIYHQTDKRIEAHIFIAFIAYCLHVTLKQRTRSCAPGLTPRAVLEKFATMQMVDVHLPTTDGRQLVLPRYTQPDSDHQLLFQQLKLNLPAQPPPRICV